MIRLQNGLSTTHTTVITARPPHLSYHGHHSTATPPLIPRYHSTVAPPLISRPSQHGLSTTHTTAITARPSTTHTMAITARPPYRYLPVNERCNSR